ncbi:MAG: putative lipoprotein, partial [Rhizobium sp.]|nr:putative lipoprotein [Rhizobium sp.]
KVSAVKAVKLPSGSAIRIVYTSNSEPNAVTTKQVRLENERYLYFKDGKLVSLELYAPKGADNVDQWQLMSRSFKWN